MPADSASPAQDRDDRDDRAVAANDCAAKASAAPALDAPALVAELRATFDAGVTLPVSWRREQLRGLRRLLVEEEAELLAALAADLGKPAEEAFLTEIGVVLAELSNTERNFARWLRPKRVPAGIMLAPATASVRREPLGVALVIAPWNYPLNLSLTPLIGAIAAGCAAVLKPSELAPATSAALARLVPKHLDPRAIRVVEGGVPETTALLAERWDTIFYTGNGTVARIIARAAAEHLTPTTLELGGKSPTFVDESVDLIAAARRIAWGKFTNAGQTCVAPDYVLATPAAARVLERELPRAVEELFGADPAVSKDYGRIVNERHFDRVSALLGSGRIVVGGESDRDARYLAPTILADVDPASPVMQEEIFGPVLPILEVADDAEAIRFIREREKPLALYVFSERKAVRRRFLKWTSSGAITFGLPIAHLSIAALPFGGVGESGMGSYHGEASIRAFSHERGVVAKPMWPETLALAFPPIDPRRMALLRRLMR